MTSATGAHAVPDRRAYRLTSIDMLRGLVILIMALDHVRDFVMVGGVQDPMSDPNISPLLFMTRWVTHFCAPVFVLLAGTSAGLMAARKSPSALAAFLATRGLWIIFIEVTVLSTAYTFAPFGLEQLGGRTLVILQVLWAIGASMIVLAGAQFLGVRACILIGAAIVLGHNLLDAVWPKNHPLETGSPLWSRAASRPPTLGPAAVVCAYADRFRGWFKDTLVMFGRVPFAFYIAHFYLAHALAVVIGVFQGFTVSQMMTLFVFNPKGFGLGLLGVYVAWLLVIVLLYPMCRWVTALKARRADWWLSYL